MDILRSIKALLRYTRIQLDPTGYTWIQLRSTKIYMDPPKIHMDPTGSNWIQLDPIDSTNIH